jgi:hypothetical protein
LAERRRRWEEEERCRKNNGLHYKTPQRGNRSVEELLFHGWNLLLGSDSTVNLEILYDFI